ncbi:GNAT family N-acetyltransferase [Rivibacter subsaxonicus]|uniref:Putative acetyltransferase n=1 Tax=Rivibacter subsaxonicus TaxID=457575 RepID=A0A4Q7VNP8_9BURK|nr:GNAT family N-acetyltransferase [Rivibacter subsaxonicus]RZT98001.1 putative acetyltransferase [Rivibacter subsaxonicus]
MNDALIIRRVTLDDAAAVARVMGDPGIYPGLMQIPYTSVELWRERLAKPLQPPELMLLAERAGEVLGTCGLHPVHPSVRRRHAMILGISVLPQAQRQGVGSALMQALCDYADRWAHVLRLELNVYCDNAPAIALYRKHGFEIEGTHRAYALRDGAYVDSHSMARLHPNPPQLPAR